MSEYICAKCKGKFFSDWTDEEALKEAEQSFGKAVSEWKDFAVKVCDVCYEKMLPKDHPELLEKAKKYL